MNRLRFLMCCLLLIFLLCGCTSKNAAIKSKENSTRIVDVYGNTAELSSDARIVSAYGSFSECWLLAGGNLVGVTEDAISERNLVLDEDVEIIGTVKDVNLEKVISLDPDYVILSADIAAHASMSESFESLNIPYGYFRVDSFEDYSRMMSQFCSVTGQSELYQKNVTDVEEKIDGLLSCVPDNSSETYLLMRVYSTGIKVKSDNIADRIIKDLGGISITDKSPSLLKDLSIEEVIKCDPDHIFIMTMGNEKNAEEYFNKSIVSDPAWQGLSAIRKGNYHMLPKELFHYKPNNRWAESYKYIAEILYPDVEFSNEE